jgi:hypothetical protein
MFSIGEPPDPVPELRKLHPQANLLVVTGQFSFERAGGLRRCLD